MYYLNSTCKVNHLLFQSEKGRKSLSYVLMQGLLWLQTVQKFIGNAPVAHLTYDCNEKFP